MLGFIFANWKWLGSAALAAFLSFTVTGAFKDRAIAERDTTIAKLETARETDRNTALAAINLGWQRGWALKAARDKAEQASTAKAEQSLLGARDQATVALASARAELDKERKSHAFDDNNPLVCIGTPVLRLRLDEASGATEPAGSGDAGSGPAAKAAAVAGSAAPTAAQGSCLTADNALQALLNDAEYIRQWGAQYDALRGWALGNE